MRLKGISTVAFFLMLCGLAATVAHAQLNRAVMEGIVTDPQGLVVAELDTRGSVVPARAVGAA